MNQLPRHSIARKIIVSQYALNAKIFVSRSNKLWKFSESLQKDLALICPSEAFEIFFGHTSHTAPSLRKTGNFPIFK